MIREHRPSLQLPAKIARQPQQSAMQNRQPVRTAKVMFRTISPRGDEVGSLARELMKRRVRPGNRLFWHGAKVRNRHAFWQDGVFAERLRNRSRLGLRWP
jgi:hypothetical protein